MTDWLHWRAVLINLCLFVFLLFFTAPELIAATIESSIPDVGPSSLRIYLPSLILNIVGKICPILVLKSILWLGYWKQSQINCGIVRLSTLYLLGVVLVLPTLGFISLEYAVDVLWKIFTVRVSRMTLNSVTTPQWFCIFLPQGGLFYGNFHKEKEFFFLLFSLL